MVKLNSYLISRGLSRLVTVVGLALLASFSAHGSESNKGKELLEVVNQYYAALEARSTSQLAKIVDPSLIILEGTYKNVGWDDYRDHHIGPEMKEWKSFTTKDRKILRTEESGNMGYVIVELQFTMVLPKETVNLSGAETFILVKNENGFWRVQHVHSSAKVIKANDAKAKPSS